MYICKFIQNFIKLLEVSFPQSFMYLVKLLGTAKVERRANEFACLHSLMLFNFRQDTADYS